MVWNCVEPCFTKAKPKSTMDTETGQDLDVEVNDFVISNPLHADHAAGTVGPSRAASAGGDVELTPVKKVDAGSEEVFISGSGGGMNTTETRRGAANQAAELNSGERKFAGRGARENESKAAEIHGDTHLDDQVEVEVVVEGEVGGRGGRDSIVIGGHEWSATAPKRRSSFVLNPASPTHVPTTRRESLDDLAVVIGREPNKML